MEYTPYGKGMPELLYENYEELKQKFRRLKKEYNQLQVEHSSLLFDKDAVIEYEVDVKCKSIREENKKLKERLDRKEELNKSYRKEIKEHKLYEEKLEHRIIEFEELLHGE